MIPSFSIKFTSVPKKDKVSDDHKVRNISDFYDPKRTSIVTCKFLLTKDLRPYTTILLVNLTLFLLCAVVNARWLNEVLLVPLAGLLGGGAASMNPYLNPVYFVGICLIYWVRRPFLSIFIVVIFSFLYQLYLRDFSNQWRLLGITAPPLFSEAKIYGGILSLSLIGSAEKMFQYFTKAKLPSCPKKPIGDHLLYAVGSMLVIAFLAYTPFISPKSKHQSIRPTALHTTDDSSDVKQAELKEKSEKFPSNRNQANTADAEQAERANLIHEGAQLGNASSQNTLVTMHKKGSGAPQDRDEAIKWFRKAAEKNNIEAQFYLAQAYMDGDGVTQDFGESFKWYKKAAEQGAPDSQFNVGMMYASGIGTEKDIIEASVWLLRAAKQGHAKAQYNLAEILMAGNGTPKNTQEAIKWYKEAARHNDPVFKFILGSIYLEGRDINRDYPEAAKWLRAAAEDGYQKAQYNLGLMYINGWGVSQDYAQALKWFKACAQQGDRVAQLKVGSMYFEGKGVLRDYSEAYIWFYLAAAQGEEIAIDGMSIIEKRLNPEQIVEAQRKARALNVRFSSPREPAN